MLAESLSALENAGPSQSLAAAAQSRTEAASTSREAVTITAYRSEPEADALALDPDAVLDGEPGVVGVESTPNTDDRIKVSDIASSNPTYL